MAFCRRIGVRHTRLNYIHPCWYMEYLASLSYSPGAISNHISHLRTFYRLAGLHTSPLHHYRVHLALRAISITLRHTPNPKLAVTPAILKKALHHIRLSQANQGVALAIIIMFMAFLRQSSLTPPTVKAFDPSRHLTREDVHTTANGLSIQLKWSKTIQKSCDLKTILIPPTQDPELCPVRAYAAYSAALPAPSPKAPLLVFPDYNPITTRHVCRLWTQALKDAGLSPSAYSLHSLRKGGASYAYNDANAKLNDVMSQGTWRSLSVRDYICPAEQSMNSVHRALTAL